MRHCARHIAGALLLCLAAAACTPIGSAYSERSYHYATELKARSLALIDRSANPFRTEKAEVEAVMVEIDAAYEYAAGLPRNAVSARQWDLMRAPEEGLMGGFVALWREQGTLGAFFREERKTQVRRAYDRIICLEANKTAPRRCAEL
jgi:hypothetical protein